MRLRSLYSCIVLWLAIANSPFSMAQDVIETTSPPQPSALAERVDGVAHESEPEQVIVQATVVELGERSWLKLLRWQQDESSGIGGDTRDGVIQRRIPGEVYDKLREPLDSDMHTLSAPTIRTRMDQEATIQMGSRQQIQYLVRGKGETFQLRTKDVELGFRFGIKPQRAENNHVALSIDFETKTLDGRQPLPGVNLDAGEPIVSTRTLKTSIILKDGEKTGLSLPGPEGRAGIVFLTVAIANDSPSEKSDKAPKPIPRPVP